MLDNALVIRAVYISLGIPALHSWVLFKVVLVLEK